jgi:hypothetical protein
MGFPMCFIKKTILATLVSSYILVRFPIKVQMIFLKICLFLIFVQMISLFPIFLSKLQISLNVFNLAPLLSKKKPKKLDYNLFTSMNHETVLHTITLSQAQENTNQHHLRMYKVGSPLYQSDLYFFMLSSAKFRLCMYIEKNHTMWLTNQMIS